MPKKRLPDSPYYRPAKQKGDVSKRMPLRFNDEMIQVIHERVQTENVKYKQKVTPPRYIHTMILKADPIANARYQELKREKSSERKTTTEPKGSDTSQ